MTAWDDKLAIPLRNAWRMAQYAPKFTTDSEGKSMTVYFITRHAGAVAWAHEEGVEAAQVVEHLDATAIRPGDVAIGTLPVNLAAEVCARGGRYLHLSLDLPPELRGKDLSADDMRRCGARLEEYFVQSIARKPHDESIG